MEYVILAVSILSLIVSAAVLLSVKKRQGKTVLDENDKREMINAFSSSVGIISNTLENSNIKSYRILDEKLSAMEKQLGVMRAELSASVKDMQESNEKKLDEMRKTVDEKLTSTLNDRFKESFSLLTAQLEQVTKTVGEMQNMSADVGNLTRMLSSVKTTGIFGEIQLGAIIEQMLAPEMYVRNVVTYPGSSEPVEFAVKFPGSDGETVLMPIDSKFPYKVYTDLVDAYQKGDEAEFKAKESQLTNTVRNMARDIHDKYIRTPYTTDFAVMFLPIEGLFAEIAKRGLIEELQNKYHITIAGPTTLCALLNSLQMGFRTLVVQEKSAKVWRILEKTKDEFARFNKILSSIQTRFNKTNSDLDKLIGTRSNAIERALREVTLSPSEEIEDTSDYIDDIADDETDEIDDIELD
jgi:DNA recombination protein RmuC